MIPLTEVLAPERPKDEKFRVETLGEALWAARKLRAIRTKEATAKAEAAAQIQLITDWLRGVTDECAQEANYFEGLLAPWTLQQIADTKKKSVKLPGATVGYRSAAPTLSYDEATLLAWAETHKPELVRVKREIAKSALNQVVLKDGQVLRGDGDALLVRVEEKPDTFYATFSDAKESEAE